MDVVVGVDDVLLVFDDPVVTQSDGEDYPHTLSSEPPPEHFLVPSTRPRTGRPSTPVPWFGTHQGLYICGTTRVQDPEYHEHRP